MDRKKTAWFFGWLVTRKGSDTSGNWMHKGDPPNRGGSAPGGGHAAMGIAAGTPTEEVKEKIQARREEMKAKKEKPEKEVQKAGTAPTDWNFDKYISAYDRVDKKGASFLSRGFDQSYTEFRQSPMFYDWVKGNADLLAKEAGVDSGDVQAQIAQWAGTSNDTSIRSLSFQAAIASEFNVPLSDWQVKQSIEATQKYPTQPTWMQQNDSALWQLDEAKRVARTMYDRTQQDLANSGYKPGDTIRLYRGVSGAGHTKVGDVVELDQNAASSWSLDYMTASGFGLSKDGGRTLAMDVPIESILSTARTGLGTLGEAEFVVLGTRGAQALVVEQSYKSSSYEGWAQ